MAQEWILINKAMRISIYISYITLTSVMLITPCFADVIHLKNGNKIEGEVIKEDNQQIELKITGGSVVLHMAEISRIEHKEFKPKETSTATSHSGLSGSYVPECIKALNTTDRIRHKELLREMSSIRDPNAIPALIDILKTRKMWKNEELYSGRKQLSGYYREMHERKNAMIALLAMSKNIENIGYFENAISIFIETLEDGELHSFTDGILKNIGRPTIPPLIRVLKNRNADERMRVTASFVFKSIGFNYGEKRYKEFKNRYGIPSEYVSDIVELMEDENDKYIYKNLLDSFRYIVDDANLGLAVSTLLNALKKVELMEQREKEDIDYAVFQVLVKVKDEEALTEAIPAVLKAADGKYGETAQRDSIKILANAGKHGIPALVECWKRNIGGFRDEAGSDRAGTKLIEMSSPGVEALIETMKDSDREDQNKIVNLLLQIRDKEAIPSLIDALDEKDKSVRKNVLSVLQKLTDRKFKANSKEWQDWWEKEKDIFEIRWVGGVEETSAIGPLPAIKQSLKGAKEASKRADRARSMAEQTRAKMESRIKALEPKPFDTPYGTVYYKMPAEELEKVGYTESLRRKHPSSYYRAHWRTYDDFNTPEEGDLITFAIHSESGKILNWYRTPAPKKGGGRKVSTSGYSK